MNFLGKKIDCSTFGAHLSSATIKSYGVCTALLALSLTAFCSSAGCVNGTIGRIDGELQCGPDARVTQNIQGGGPNSLLLTESQKLAVGAININREQTGGGTNSNCSGTLIAPRWVLTAKHCTDIADEGETPSPSTATSSFMFFRAGPVSGGVTSGITGAQIPDYKFSVSRIVFPPNPESDLALVELSQDVVAAHPEIQPIGITKLQPTEDWNYERRFNVDTAKRTPEVVTEIAGFGKSSRARDFTSTQVWRVFDDVIRTWGEDLRGPCGGDSGGPLFVRDEDGVGRLAGALYRGLISRDECKARDDYSRVDRYSPFFEWISTTVCGGADKEGKCIGVLNSCTTLAESSVSQNSNNKASSEPVREKSALAKYGKCTGRNEILECNGTTTPETRTCPEGKICGWSESAARFDCISPSQDPCEGVSNVGRCGGNDGNGAEWCDVEVKVVDGVEVPSARIMRRNCTACDSACALVAGVGVDCRPNDCGDIDSKGVCDGNVARWCSESKQLQEVDCGMNNSTCGVISGNHRCLDEEARSSSGFVPVGNTGGDSSSSGGSSGSNGDSGPSLPPSDGSDDDLVI